MKLKPAAQLMFAALWLLVSWRSYAAEPLAFGDVACEGDYQHHLQGVCTNENDAIYWSFTTELETTKASFLGCFDENLFACIGFVMYRGFHIHRTRYDYGRSVSTIGYAIH